MKNKKRLLQNERTKSAKIIIMDEPLKTCVFSVQCSVSLSLRNDTFSVSRANVQNRNKFMGKHEHY